MGILMETSDRRYGKTRMNPRSSLGPFVEDMMIYPSQPKRYQTLTGFDPALDAKPANHRWLNVSGRKPAMFEVNSW